MTQTILDRIAAPSDLADMQPGDFAMLAREIRQEIMSVMAANGGHLATNLGTVELSLALHAAFDSPRDKLLWDVGNQCYTHKLLTGRRPQFSSIRKQGGLSGFIHRLESPHDHLTSGHAGTALSSALGLATARDRLGEDYAVVSTVGDGALTSGLAYEALNNLAELKSQLLVILNDNGYAIGRSRGGLAGVLDRSRTRILDGTIFEQFGINYLGPVDGHNVALMVDVFKQVKTLRNPVVLHVLTQKGKGYQPAEQDPELFHGTTSFDLTTGKPYETSDAPTYSELLGQGLIELARADRRIMAVTAAMQIGTGLSEFARHFPDRCFDVGIAEQHAVTFASGLALGGCRPVVAIYSTFLQRSYDQIIHDVCLQDLPVTFVLDRAGIVGADGATHHGVFDLAYLRVLPNMVVMAPRDAQEFRAMLRFAVQHDGPIAIRVPRGAAPARGANASRSPIELGKAELVRHGTDVALLTAGSMEPRAQEVAEQLEAGGVSAALINLRFVKPLDENVICETAKEVRHVFTLEEHVEQGGLGSAVLELLARRGIPTPVTVLGLPDRFVEHGCAATLLEECGLSVGQITERIVAELRAVKPTETSSASLPDAHVLRREIQRVINRPLPNELNAWVTEYERVGSRDAFLWKWCVEGVELTSLPCVSPALHPVNTVTKVLGVMFDVLVDDVADRYGSAPLLEELAKIPLAAAPLLVEEFSGHQRAYLDLTQRLWRAIVDRAQRYPRYREFEQLLQYDYRQLLNAMRYSHLINAQPELLNLVEHDLYLPHNMHMMISGTLDLMCSPSFDVNELGRIREVLWHAQCMGRIGNLLTTWEREIGDGDYTSGVFAHAIRIGAVTPSQLRDGNRQQIRMRIQENDCEQYFHKRWRTIHDELNLLADSIHSVNVRAVIEGLEKLFVIHLGSRGLK